MTQRERLLEAITAVAARHGYTEASVARVVKQAGVSRATFYEHFEDRDDCFLAAFHRAAEPVRRELDRAGGRGSRDRPREVIELLLRAADADPAAARLVLIEAMAGNEAVCVAHEELLADTEAAIDRHLDAAGPDEPQIEIPARALLGGVASLVGMRVFRHEGTFAELGDDLVAWLQSYALPPGRQRLNAADWVELGEAWARLGYRPLSSSSAQVVSGLAPSEGDGERRRRVIEAVARCTREKTYTETSVADIVAAAGVSRASFYEQFRNKEDAFLGAQAFGLEGAAAVTAARFFTEAPWPERLWNAADGLLEYIAERPDLSHLQLVECYRAGPAAIRRSFENRMAFTIFFEEGYRQRAEAEALPRISSEAISGANEELFRVQVVRGRTELARELVPPGTYITLAPFIGAEAALDFVRERCRIAA